MAYLIEKANLQNEIPRGNTPEFDSNDYFIISDLAHASTKWVGYTILPTTVLSILARYRKLDGDNITEMNQSEKDAADQAIADAQAQAEDNAKDIDNLEDNFKRLAKLTFQEINKLRVENSDPEYTWTQFKTAFKNAL